MAKHWQSMTELERLESRLKAWQECKPCKMISQDLIEKCVAELKEEIEAMKTPTEKQRDLMRPPPNQAD